MSGRPSMTRPFLQIIKKVKLWRLATVPDAASSPNSCRKTQLNGRVEQEGLERRDRITSKTETSRALTTSSTELGAGTND